MASRFLLSFLIGLLGAAICYLKRQPKKPSNMGRAISVSLSKEHVFSKDTVDSIILLAGLGVEGDCHCGTTVQHRSRLKIRPVPANLRQVHLMQSELFEEFKSEDSDGKIHYLKPGDLGENITTQGLDLLGMGIGTRLHFINPGTNEKERHAIVRITGLRNPCPQIHNFQNGLQEKCLVRGPDGGVLQRKAGIMSVVESGGIVTNRARIIVERPDEHVELPCV